ncbi:MAG: pseudouridine synthase [Opitutaceae bacterium]
MELSIIYRDENFIAIDKPSGLLVHRTSLDTQATEFALQILRDQIGQNVHPCHRLDRPTSGILLFALNPEALKYAQNVFAERRVEKTYHAIVRGWPEETGTINYDLRSEENRKLIQNAVTGFRCLAKSEVDLPIGRYSAARYALLELIPTTGRKHQLRRHLAHIRHPIIGDTRHGDGAQNRFIREHFDCNRLLLHATRLCFKLPESNSLCEIVASADDSFESVSRHLRLTLPQD